MKRLIVFPLQGLTEAMAITVAHEIAHTMGVLHDETSESIYSVMSPSIRHWEPEKVIRWSQNSTDIIKGFLNSRRSHCLAKESDDDKFDDGLSDPGVKFDLDHQCQLLYGRPNAFSCGDSVNPYANNYCMTLW